VSELRDHDPHLFRHEAPRMVAALTRIFGVQRLALAEDVAQDAICRALEVWKTRGIPENPSAWLMATAKNRALDLLRRERTAQQLAPELSRALVGDAELCSLVDVAFSAPTIRDEQLRMMFSCAHPRLPEAAQLALILNVLCGFGASEIAGALLTGHAAIEKRISRGKKALAGAQLFDLADAEFEARLDTVRRALYLLFSEGYHGSSDAPVRAELCEEALRLTSLLRQYPPADSPTTRALAALMYLHCARLPARLDVAGDLNALADQDRSRWDRALVAEGLRLFEASACGRELSQYHVEAAIAAAHAAAAELRDTNWALIVSLYDQLMRIAPSPVVALNRAIAIGELEGPAQGLRALRDIDDAARLAHYPFYAAALGELELRRGDRPAARQQFHTALSLARNASERRFLEKRLARALPD
jgi:RNA polymerase sigma factor (sigma-70 family)